MTNYFSATLMVEILHDHFPSFVLLADDVLHWHLDVTHFDVCSPGRPNTRAIHLPTRNTRHALLKQDERQTFVTRAAGTHDDREEVSENAVRNPLLLSINDVMLAVGSLFGGGTDVGDITSSCGLGHAETDDFFAFQDWGHDPLLHRLASPFVDGGQT